jgi:hypothetical protein
MNREERIYRAMLRVYPRPFLDGYESEMLVAFRDQRRDGGDRHAPWPALLADISRSAPIAWRDYMEDTLHTGVATMKAMAVLATVIGGFEIVNTILELAAGGVGGRRGIALLGLALAIVAGIGLAAAGIALIRRGRDAVSLVTRVSIACLVLFGAAAATRPGLSGAANVAGLGFPLVFLGFLMFNRSSRLSP